MARFTSAARALRGPFKKLVRKLELTLRKPIVKKLGSVGKAVSRKLFDKDARLAVHTAQEEARRLRSTRVKPPTTTSVAVDRTTGRVVGMGHNRENLTLPPELLAKLSPVRIELRWSPTNCGEVAAAARAMDAGSRIEDLVIRTVRTTSGTIFPPCKNCEYWVPGGPS